LREKRKRGNIGTLGRVRREATALYMRKRMKPGDTKGGCYAKANEENPKIGF